MMTEKTKVKLLKLADFLVHKVKSEWFNLDWWATRGFTERKCGTTACAVGWATICFPDSGLRLKKAITAPTMHVVYKGEISTCAAAKFFDIDVDTAEYLFIPSQYRGSTSKDAVVRRIRRVVRTEKWGKQTVGRWKNVN